MSILCPPLPSNLLACPAPLNILFDTLPGGSQHLPPARHFVSFDVYRNKAPLCVVVAVKDCGVFYGGDDELVASGIEGSGKQRTEDDPFELSDLSRASLETVRLDTPGNYVSDRPGTSGSGKHRSRPSSGGDPELSSLLTLGAATDGRHGSWIRSSVEEGRAAVLKAAGGGEKVDEKLLRSESTLAFRKGQRMAVVETVGGWYIGWLLPSTPSSNTSTPEDSLESPTSNPDLDLARLRFSISNDDGLDFGTRHGQEDGAASQRRVGLIPADKVVVCRDWLRRRFVGASA
ncbi:hypothetical protein M427DRAFT_58351 [Gonapodya prolifera JEL478]|uniref:Uncharacterized protein n=1 Tax=Gonapodya prolifera (strain JEL478) TaxID=1344416 RepID=A0A139AAK2_GONPJ|nr:hypothetical protein M427DRAFT_58351 [Gonapodya prolifera JEL478]|eukprot:KXS13757.1 hypothetical protein M427DRAFT_58351 [Gonapodya prolifera JEL478]